jgi:hypothetical protein
MKAYTESCWVVGLDFDCRGYAVCVMCLWCVCGYVLVRDFHASSSCSRKTKVKQMQSALSHRAGEKRAGGAK